MSEDPPGPMAGTATLVSGGTGGIGRATAVGLAAPGARVGITSRDAARTQAAAAAIARESGNPCVDAFAADMSCQAELRRLAAAVLDAYPRLDVLVNNVGGFWATRHITADGLERTFAVNSLLLDLLKASAPARIVTVSLASASEVDGVTGQYFAHRRPTTPDKAPYDAIAAARLWDASARLICSGQETQGASSAAARPDNAAK